MRTKTCNIKRQLQAPANYALLLGTKKILRECILQLRSNPNSGHNFQELLQRATFGLRPLAFHAYSYERATQIINRCKFLISEMHTDFLRDLSSYMYEKQLTLQQRAELETPALLREHLEYLDYFLTYDLELKLKKYSPVGMLRAKEAAKKNPIRERTLKKKELALS